VRRIYKYTLFLTDSQEIRLPKGAQILCVQAQAEVPCLWALVDPRESVERRIILMIGTGASIEEPERPLIYLDTFQLRAGELIFHVFERLP
jgi:hypothetical protein